MARYGHHLFFCAHQRPVDDERGCCQQKGALGLADFAKAEVARRKWKKEVRVNVTGCLNACAHGPSVVVYPEAVWYRLSTKADVLKVLDEHVGQGRACSTLLSPVATANHATVQDDALQSRTPSQVDDVTVGSDVNAAAPAVESARRGNE